MWHVDRVAESCETAWGVEVEALGYDPPPLEGGPGGSRYLVRFQEMANYGATTVSSGTQTFITLHRNFEFAAANGDPDGAAIGAMRATVAHELRHAVQRVYNLWSEGDWNGDGRFDTSDLVAAFQDNGYQRGRR